MQSMLKLFRAPVVWMILISALVGFIPSSAEAVTGQAGAQQVTLNPGGGILTNGTDGIRFTINSASASGSYDAAIPGQDGVFYRATRPYCCGAGAPMLNIGGTLFGQAGPASGGGVAIWNSIAILSTSGSASIGTRTSSTGSAEATVRYTAIKNSRSYIIDRTVSYTYPNDYVTDTYNFTIPTGNTEAVKFYLGGDTAPGSSDQGYGVMLTSPVRTVISLNTSSDIMFGFREVSGSKTFDGATSQGFSIPYATVTSGGNIGFVGSAFNHDAGLMMQWNLGSTPGTQTASLQQFATQQGSNLNASFASLKAEPNQSVQLNLSIVNTELSTVTGVGFVAALPSGLVIGSGAPTNGCSGTLTATAGTGAITLSGGSLGATTNCVISVPVLSAATGTYTISTSAITGTTSLTNNVGTSSLVITDDNDDDGIANAIENASPNSGDANNDGTADRTQLNVTSFVNPVSTAYSSIVVDSACELSSVSAASANALGADTGYEYPMGLLDFTASCGTPGYTATITQYFFNPPTESFILRKYAGSSYQTVSGAAMTSVTVGGVPALRVSYQVTDGGPLDDDGLANGVIVDPAGPAVIAAAPSPSPTPTPSPVVLAAVSTPTPTATVPSTGLPPANMAAYFAAIIAAAAVIIAQLALQSRATREVQPENS